MPNLVFLASSLFILLGVYLIYRSSAVQWGNVFLGLFFICMGLSVIDVNLSYQQFYQDHLRYANWLSGLPLLYGPLLYFYTLSYVHHLPEKKWKTWIHFVPFLVVFVMMLFLYHFRSNAYQAEFMERALNNSNGFSAIASVIILFLILGYLLSSIRLINRHNQYLKSKYSNLENRQYFWIKYILYGILAIMLHSLVMQVTFLFFDSVGIKILLISLLVMMLVFIIYGVFLGLSHNQVFESMAQIQPDPREDARLSEEMLVKRKELEQILEAEKLYLESDLKLDDLARKLHVNARTLSEIINQGMGKSFFDLINDYRIEYTKHLMKTNTDKRKTILEFMYESGFNSKSSFNTAFRKYTGSTPTEWMRKNTV